MNIDPLRTSAFSSASALNAQSVPSVSNARSKRNVAVVDLETQSLATRVVKADDAILSEKYSAALLELLVALRTGTPVSPAAKVIDDIPRFSTFGMAWAQLTHAIESEPFASFARKHKIDTSTLKLNTVDGWELECIADGKPASFSKYDEGWWQATAAVTAAAQALAPTRQVIEYLGPTRAPAQVIGNFYEVGGMYIPEGLVINIAEQKRHGTFVSLPSANADASGSNDAHDSVIRQQQQDAIEVLSTQITLTPSLIPASRRDQKPSVEEADLEMARMYSTGRFSEISGLGVVLNKRSHLLVSEIPERSTLGQTLRNSAVPPAMNKPLSLDWIGRFYGEPTGDGSTTWQLKNASSLTRDGFAALRKHNPRTDRRSVGVQERQRAVAQRLEQPHTTQPRATASPAANPLVTLARSQFAGEPTLFTAVARVLNDRIQTIAPGLDVDVNQLAIELPDPDQPGQFKRTQLITLALDHLAGGPAPNFTRDAKAFDTRPRVPRTTLGSPVDVPLHLDLAGLSSAIGALPSRLDEVYNSEFRAYWSKPAFSGADNAFSGSHRALVSSILRSNLQQAALKQTGLDDEQRKTLTMVASQPNGATRPMPLGANSSGADVYTTTGPEPELLITRSLSSPSRQLLLLVETSGKVTPYDSWDDLPESRRPAQRVDANVFDLQADRLIQQHKGDQLSNAPALTDMLPPTQPTTTLPDWMNNADQSQRFVLQELHLRLAGFIQLNKGRTYSSDIPDIRTFAERSFDNLKAVSHPAKNLEIVFKVPVGGAGANAMVSGIINRERMSLTDALLKNLSGLPSRSVEVYLKPDNTRVPELEEDGALQKLIEAVDVGKNYPALLKRELLDNPDKKTERQSLFAQQVPTELQLKALEMVIQKKSGLDNTGFRYIQAALDPTPGAKTVDGKEIAVRPLAFIPGPGKAPDVVDNMYLIEPEDSEAGPHILYRPLIADAPLLQFQTRKQLLEAIQQPGRLQSDILAWLPDESTREYYKRWSFKEPDALTLGVFGVGDGETVPAEPKLAAGGYAAADTLKAQLQTGHLMDHLYNANAQALTTLAEQQAVSDDESRWATLKEGGFLLLNALLPALRGPGALLGLALQGAGIASDLEVLHGDDMRLKETALADMLLNLATSLIHFKARALNEPSSSAARAAGAGAMLVEEIPVPATPPKNRIVLGGPVEIKPLAGDIQVFFDTYKGHQRLNIMGHSEQPANGGASSILGENGKRYAAADVDRELLARGINIRDYEDVRLLACYSASGGQASLASQLNALTGARVKGFEQEIVGDFPSVDNKDPYALYEEALGRYRNQYKSLPDKYIQLLAEKAMNDTLAERNIAFNVKKDNGTEVELNIGSDEKPVFYKTRVDYKPRSFDSAKISSTSSPVEVHMGYSHTVQDLRTPLSTRSLTECSALAVLTDLKDGVYQKRTLMHLTGSDLRYGLIDKVAYEEVEELNKSLDKGGKVIFVGGVNSQSTVGMGAVLAQEYDGKKPLFDLLKKPGVDVTIAGSVGVTINPDGSFQLIEDTGKGVFAEKDIKDLFAYVG
ncbi:hypothetical protein HFD98_23405 [Pseudomonas sp. EKM23D]|uniref:hypothetical protein n=1 Tax=Pseudomonas TaxID=286 RepID=UPI00142E912B|nr:MULTISPECIES: hypothetical protein [Pseudomonas]KAF6687433.1 hypothetical protein HFD98_23405 [Pseudomonas sp. EKM23D]QKJ73367.1 hypothetical protein HRH33_12540 [Pseudomonas rhodesiae]